MLKLFQNMAMQKIEEQRLKNSENKEIKPGALLYAKVIKAESNMYLLNLKGQKILAKSERPLKEGELVKLRIEKINEDNQLIVKIEDEPKKTDGTVSKENPEMLSLLKKEILKHSMEEKIYLNNKEIDELALGLEHYQEKGKEIEESLVKTLLFVKKHGYTDEETFNGLRKFYSKKVDKGLPLEKLSENLKKEVESFKEESTALAKGLNKINSVSVEQGYLNIIFALVGFFKPIQVEFKAENKEKELEKDNMTIVIKLQLEYLGKLDISINIWKKKIELYFITYDDVDKRVFKNLKELKKRLEDIGYIVEGIHISRRVENKAGDIYNINYRI
jgi:hypothetical protein